MNHSVTNGSEKTTHHPHKLPQMIQAGLLLLIPLATLILRSDSGPAAPLPSVTDDSAAVQAVLNEPFLIADIQTLPNIEPSLDTLQNLHYQQSAAVAQLSPGELMLMDSPLFWWERIERTARRHKSTLDYFLGFGY